MKEIYSVGENKFYHSIWQDRSASQQYKHNLIFPKNTYSPWEGDNEFMSIFNQIKEKNTLVDIYRCYELWSLASQHKNKKGDIIEVGVWRGGTGLILASANQSATVYLCDTFEGVVKASSKDSVYKGGEHNDTSEKIVTDLLKKNNLNNFKLIKGIFPDQTENKIDSETFKLCHIDVDVYESAKDIFNWVWPKLIKGGIVVFDDYGFAACEGITSLVNELNKETEDSLLIYNCNGHGLIIKI